MANRTINDLTAELTLADTDSFELQKTGAGGVSKRVELSVLSAYLNLGDQDVYKTIAADSGTPTTANSPTDTLNIVGGTDINTVVSDDTITINSTAVAQVAFAGVIANSSGFGADQAQDIMNIFGEGGIFTQGDVLTDTLTIIGGLFSSSAQAGGTKILTSGDRRTTWTNLNAISLTTFNLPTAIVNDWFKFVNVESGQLIRIVPSGAEYIADGDAGKYLEMQSEGSVVWLYCYKTGSWAIESETGINRIQEET